MSDTLNDGGHSLIQKLQDDKRDPRLTIEVLKLTKEYLKNHKAFLQSYLQGE